MTRITTTPKKSSGILKALAAFMMFALGLTGCMDDDFSDCVYDTGAITIKVVVSAESVGAAGGLDAATFTEVTLYVFGEDGRLLATIPTEIGRTETLNFPGAGKLTVAAVGNSGVHAEPAAMTPGTTTLDQARIMLTRSVSDAAYYNSPSDLFLGDVEVQNNQASGEEVELPISRVVAGVYVYVRGVNEFRNDLTATTGDYHVVLGGQYNYVDLLGTPGYMTGRSQTDPVQYLFDGTRRSGSGTSFFDFPHQTAPDTKTAYCTVLASDAGMPVSVGLYYKGVPVIDPITTTGTIVGTTVVGTEPLTIRNNMLNVIAIDFTVSGGMSVKMNDPNWRNDVQIGKDYGQP